MNTDITYEQLKPFLTDENLLWTEYRATLQTPTHESARIAWIRLFEEDKPTSPQVVARIDGDYDTYNIFPGGRTHMSSLDCDRIYQLPEAAMQALGLAAKSAAQELREALGDDIPWDAPIDPPEIGHLQAAINYPHPGWDYSETFRHVLSMIQDYRVAAACSMINDSEEFDQWPASLSHHHAYEGGLIKHTLEVLDIALHIAGKFPSVNRDVLIAAALWHDFAKVHEYRVDVLGNLSLEEIKAKGLLKSRGFENEVWVRTDYASKIGHICGSAMDFTAAARQHGVLGETIAAVAHCILAHHGPVKEWGSPVAPQTLEALILHQADMQSSQFGAIR